MRKNNQLQDAYANFEGFLEAGLMYMSNKTGNHFKSCHILVPDRPDVEGIVITDRRSVLY